ncbi:MAG: hypothetical protein M3008_04895, partial [Chloroflexota bacterium]|nr:hypothetical protein [Chloroflexota bacterium]
VVPLAAGLAAAAGAVVAAAAGDPAAEGAVVAADAGAVVGAAPVVAADLVAAGVLVAVLAPPHAASNDGTISASNANVAERRRRQVLFMVAHSLSQVRQNWMSPPHA